eukprot:1680351-Pleurochrysis_carterae.AAC.1
MQLAPKARSSAWSCCWAEMMSTSRRSSGARGGLPEAGRVASRLWDPVECGARPAVCLRPTFGKEGSDDGRAGLRAVGAPLDEFFALEQLVLELWEKGGNAAGKLGRG